jgi:integrase
MSTRIPKYSHHKATGQARVCIDGKDHYLGAYGTAVSKRRYRALIADWEQRDGSVEISIAELVLLHDDHLQKHYRKNGKVTSEISCFKTALRFLVKLESGTLIADFGPKKFKRIREAMIADGICRLSINKHMGRIRRLLKWGVSEELIPADVLARISTVDGLQKGRTDAAESLPVLPVPDADIDAIEPFVSAPIWGIVQMQLLTSARPGEVLSMRLCDINTESAVWEYRPVSHKTEHHARSRLIMIGPKAQQVLDAFCKDDATDFVFSPRDVRDTSPGDKRRPGARYNRDAYRNAIYRACDRAGVKRWHPHRLRHNAATAIRRVAGAESAQVILGVASLRTAEIYAEKNAAAASEIINQIG